jgi:hypothetical protein
VVPLWQDHPPVFAGVLVWNGQGGQGGIGYVGAAHEMQLQPGKDTAGLREQLLAVEQPVQACCAR